MNRLILSALILFLAATAAIAQNNPYDIDDECYKYFSQAEAAVNDLASDDFEKANESLLQTALSKGDQKARTLYYVGQLKRASRRGQKAPRGPARNLPKYRKRPAFHSIITTLTSWPRTITSTPGSRSPE